MPQLSPMYGLLVMLMVLMSLVAVLLSLHFTPVPVSRPGNGTVGRQQGGATFVYIFKSGSINCLDFKHLL